MCTGLGTCPGKSSFRVIHNQFFAERVDKVLGTSGDDELIGVLRCELHRISNHISPQTGRSGDYHGVVFVQLHLLEAEGTRILLAYIFKRDELVEDTVVNHQQHGRVGRVVLRAEVAFGGVISLYIMHLAAADHVFVLLAVGSEGNAAVEEYLQVGPYLLKALLSRLFQYMFDEYKHPGRYTGKVAYICMDGFAGNGLHFGLEVLHQGCLLAGYADKVYQWVDIFYEDGGEIAYKTVVGVQVGSVAASKDKPFTGKETAFGILSQIDGNGIPASLVMRVVQGLPADGQELALVVGGTR